VTTGGAKKRHADHDEDLHLVGPQQRDAEEVAPEHIAEVEQHREDEGERQRHLDDAGDTVEDPVDHQAPASLVR
jgi:hypothetical protein